MSTLRAFTACVILAAATTACDKAKPAQESAPSTTPAATSPAGALPAPDTLRATPVPPTESAKITKQADTKGAATKVPEAGTKTPIIGRDSAPANPKLITLPVIADTLKKKRPPQ
jgi:hypothetical protein